MNKNILDRLGIIILIIKEFICILENKCIYSNIKVRVKLQADIEPVKGGGDDDGGGAMEMMIMMAPARWRGAGPKAGARLVVPPPLPLDLVLSSMVVMEQQWG